MDDTVSGNHPKLLLTEGGPIYRLEVRLGLIRADSPRIVRRAFLSILVTWIPLLVLSALQHGAAGHLVQVPFLRDFAVHARFLLSVPLLLLAEAILGPRLAHAAEHFVESGLVIQQDYEKFDTAIVRGLKWCDSTVAEALLIVLAYVLTVFSLVSMAIHVSTWYVLKTSSGNMLTWSGWWFVVFCVPLFQFLAIRWLWRLFLWAQFLWRMKNLKLQLIPTHPDEAAGLGFVGETQRFFGIILLAYSISVAGVLANGVLYDKVPLPRYAPAIAIFVLAAVAIVLLPLFVFLKTLSQTRRLGLSEYGTLGTEYASSFHHKWIVRPRRTEEDLLGTGDIQSLADLGNSYSFVEKMNALPMGPKTPAHLALACLIPMAPLLLTMMPLGELLKLAFKVVL
jgi:hypothetical protein